MLGAKWITEKRPDLSRVDYLLNEGAGAVMPYGDRRLYGVCVAEKGTFRFNVRTTGTAAHASVPGLADNALLKLAPLITRLGEGRPRYDLTEATQRAARGARRGPGGPEAARSSASRAVAPRARAAARRRDARHVRADDRLRGREDQRHPGARAGARRLPRPARDGRGRRAQARPRGARRRRLRARVHRGRRRQPLAGRVAADGRDRAAGWPSTTPAPRPSRPSCPRSPTAAGSAPRSRTASPTASSPSATRPSTRPGR